MNKTRQALGIGYLVQGKDALKFLDGSSAPCLHVVAVIKYLLRRGHRIRFVFNSQGAMSWTEEFDDGFPVNLTPVQPSEYGFSRAPWFRAIERPVRRIQSTFRFPYWAFFDNLRYSDAYASLFAGCDLIYERYMFMAYGGVLAARRLHVPHILEVNGDVFEEVAMLGLDWFSGLQGWILRLLVWFPHRFTDQIVAVSEGLAQSLKRRWRLRPERVAVVVNGVDTEFFTAKRDTTELIRRYGLDGHGLIVFVGNFFPWHGLDRLIHAFRDVLRSQPNARLILVGDGNMRPAIEAQIRSMGLDRFVILTGRVSHEEVPAWLSVADVAVAPWVEYGAHLYPLKLFEYMAAGKAIVASAVPGVCDVIQDGETGVLVPPEDVEALAQALIDLLSDPVRRARLGANARRQALLRHSWAQRVEEIEGILYNTLASASRH